VSETKSVLIPVREEPSIAGNAPVSCADGKLVKLAPLPLKVAPVIVPEEAILPEEVIVPVVFMFPVPVILLELRSRLPPS